MIAISRLDPKNLGDFMSHPSHYFNDLRCGIRLDIAHLEAEDIQRHHDGIPLLIGGGSFLGDYKRSPNADIHRALLERIAVDKGDRTIIVWGGGVAAEETAPSWLDLCDLVGIRDHGIGQRWVPCATCMHPAFSQAFAPPIHRVVGFFRDDLPVPVLGIPSMRTTQAAITNVAAFLTTGEFVVTNSYYGVYWATLLGRRVLCIPRSEVFEKFLHFKHQPIICNADNWGARMEESQAYPKALAECRATNQAFHKEVRHIL